MSSSKSSADILRNFTGILQDKFPGVNIGDIPGLDDNSNETRTNFAIFMCSLIFGIFWITYITFFNSRIVGSIVTKIANRFVKVGHVKIGSLSWSVLPGKVMFRDVLYMTPDFTIRVQDGYLIFRWWRSYVPKDVSEDLSHSDTRVSMQLYGFELHIYNRTSTYKDLEKKFGVFTGLFNHDEPSGDTDRAKESSNDSTSSSSNFLLGKNWRDLIPVVKIDITAGKFAFGNKLLPTTLVISVEEARCTYSTKPAVCALDHFMHFFKCKADNFKILLAPSPKYTGLRDEAPRFMGEGFVVASSNDVDFYYYMDEAGRVQDDMPEWAPVPEWGVDIKCGKATNFSYGPWADRQRELIYKFFFPPDYQKMEPTPEPKAGEKRVASMFRVRLSTQQVSTLDVLFSKAKETKAVHVDIGQGTNFEVKIPWVVSEHGYQTKLSGTLMMIEATTSLPFRDLLRCETLQINVEMNYPLKWNDHQEWIFTFTGSKTTLHFIFAHKWYFQDLVDDWSAKCPPDLLYFVPYTWKFQFVMKKFELVTLGNEFNWIDTSSTNQENALLAICGEHMNLKFSLPYIEFLPATIPFIFQVDGDKIDLSLYVPEVYTSHDILKSLDMNAKIVSKEGGSRWHWKRDVQACGWRNLCSYDDGWFDCWTAPKVQLDITFTYHPVPLPGPPPQAEISTPEKEMKLLSPLRVPPRFTTSATRTSLKAVIENFDPGLLVADKCKVELRVDSSTAYLYGTLIRTFMHVKENLFGEDQSFTPMDVVTSSSMDVFKSTIKLNSGADINPSDEFDPRMHRPIEVVLDISIGDLQAHLIKNCLPDDPPCPFLLVEKLAFEMDKKFRETRLQLQLSPVVLRSGHLDSTNLNQGHLLLTGLQFRGHAMFSEIDRPLGSDSLEYAWLIEIQCGSLFGKATAAQLYNVFVCLETFLFLVVDKENVLRHPRPFKICQHNENQKECRKNNTVQSDLCPTEADLKYKLARFSMDAIDVNIVDKATALRVQLCPLRFSSCNLHGLQTKQGITALVNSVLIQQYVNSNFPLSRADIEPLNHHSDIWIESGCVRFGPVYIEGSQSGGQTKNLHQSQHEFLVKHDRKTLRLWFLWPKSFVSNKVRSKESLGKCGCVGGCEFFGANENGIGFFKPSRNDIERRCNVTIPTLNDRTSNPGFGQSILRDNCYTVKDCRIFKSFAVMGEQLLPPKWPLGCHESKKLPFCPDFRTYKSSSSNNSGETPKHPPRHHRSFSGKHGKPREEPVKQRLRSASSSVDPGVKRPSSQTYNSGGKSESLAEVQSLKSEASKYTLARTESLVSDVLSFYSLDGTEPASMVSSTSKEPLQTPKSPRTTTISLSPTSTQYETATSNTASVYETASAGRSSSLSFDTATLQPESSANLDDVNEDDDTLSRTLSENSFMSAMSEHDEFGLVNLHMQVNKPITDSPLLMSNYISHLSQYRCSYWDETISMLKSEPIKSTNNIFPKFDTLEEGLSTIKMGNRDDSVLLEEESEANLTPKQTYGFDWDKAVFENPEEVIEESEGKELGILTETTSKTTIIVKFKGAIDIVISPVVLESVQRMFDALTPTFSTLHPISVVNHLHSQSLDRVESKNTLMKKEKSLDLQEKFLDCPKEQLKSKTNGKKDNLSPSSEMLRTFEKSVSSFVQASLHLPRVNFLSLQASVVEEMCAFSALDNVRDITCVSLLAVGIQETTFQFCKTSQAKKTVQMYFQKPALSSGKKKKSASKLKLIQDYRLNEPFTFESSETQKEELLMTGSLQKAHAQLRRLRNDSSILKDAYITAIPHHKSKVFFKYTNVPKLTSFRSSTPVDDEDIVMGHSVNRSEESKLGFNMCECGFEGIAIKVAKRSSNQEDCPAQDLSHLLGKPSEQEKGESLDDSVHIEVETSKKPPPKRGEERPDINIQSGKENGFISNESSSKAECGHLGGKHSTASGSVELKTSWFNFAAPPKTPISRKIDFTKLDWNLLSTASPSIDAWLNPIDRLQETASHCMSTYHRRVGAVMASLMAESLDVAAENFLKPTKYDKLTSLSKTLRDDPSCQLCAILVKYMLKLELPEVETNLDEKSVPPLTILRQGIVVLSRQWKNALYTPILIEYNLRSKGFKNLYSTNLDPIIEGRDTDSDSENDHDDLEDADEESLLLRKTTEFNLPFRTTDGSIISGFGHRLSPSHYPPLSEEQLLIYKRPGSIESLESYDPVNSVSDHVASGAEMSNRNEEDGEETLYDWMKRQQQSDESVLEKGLGEDDDDEDDIVTIKIKESLNNGGAIIDDVTPPTPQTKQMHLLDAHIIFEPLLSSLGLMPQQIQNLSLKNLGSNVSVLTNIETFKIDIVESEFGKIHKSKKGGSKGSRSRLLVETEYSPAFICEKIYMQVDLKKVTDLAVDKEKIIPLYMSRAQLKRHTSTLVNFSLDIFFISQKVNMPLLRLLNQIVTMHQNVKETSEVLKDKRPTTEVKVEPPTVGHKRSSSGSSTSSNLSVSRQAETPNFTDTSSRRTIQTPSPSVAFKSNIRARPKSFAQKFRPNSRLAGYSSGESPVLEPVQDSFILTSAPLERIAEEQTNAVKCWKTMYNLLELYSTMPVTKTVQRQSLTPVSNLESGILLRPGRRANLFNNMNLIGHQASKTPDIEQFLLNDGTKPPKKTKGVSFAKADMVRYEHTPVIVFGIAQIRSVQLTAMLSGLKLEGQINGLQTSVQYKEKIKAPQKGVVEASIVGNMQETNIALLEGLQTIVKIIVGRSQLLYSSQMWKTKDKNSGTMKVDLIQVDIPQHPVDLHSIVTRGTKELSSTLQEFRSGVRILQRNKTVLNPEDDTVNSNSFGQPSPKFTNRKQADADGVETPTRAEAPQINPNAEESNLIRPFVMQFHITLTKFTMSAALLPSLQAEYSMEKVVSRGVTGSKAKFIVDLGKHSLSFTTKLQDIDNLEANLPSEASIDLPNVHVSAEYIIQEERGMQDQKIEADGSILSLGSYLKAEAEIGELEHWLTTDLLNHLVFVQKVFMKEVNEVVQKMSGSDRIVQVWTEFGEEFVPTVSSSEKPKPLLFSVAVRLKNITITATTPANSGVRFETGVSELQISNRVENVKKTSSISTKAKVNIKLSLGHIIRDTVYYEAETQFQTQAYFKTAIQMSNAIQLQNDGTKESHEDKDVIHINLNRPLVFVQPVAIDRAILFWLSYKNAWEYWTEQRLSLNKEVLAATEQVLEKVPISQFTSHLSSQQVGTLFLQLNVRDIGLCIPFLSQEIWSNFPNSSKVDMDSKGAIVATVESSSISACSAGSMVSTGKFTELCIRFADDFNHTLDDWKPMPNDPNLMNLCLVSEGSYEVCSQTAKAHKEENAKWFLNIQWQMTGVDVHVDTNIGKHLTALGHTLTTLTGEQEFDNDDANTDRVSSSSEDDNSEPVVDDHHQHALKRQKTLMQADLDLPFLDDPKIEKNELAKYLEQEINEQAKVVEDLQKLGASEPIVASEMKKLQVLQNIASKNFRQDLVQKLRRQKSKASYIRDKFGLGPGSSNSHHKMEKIGKSKSVALPSPIKEENPGFSPKLKKIHSGETLHESSFDDSDFEFSKKSSSLTRESTMDEEQNSLVDYDESPHFPRDKSKYTLSPNKSASMTKTFLPPPEPNVDFEFHVKIFINSGKCVLHTLKEEEKRKMKKDRSFSSSNPFGESPSLSRKFRASTNPELRASYMSTSRLRDMRQVLQDVTTFFIPGLDVRVHYLSKTEVEESTLYFDPSASMSKDATWMTSRKSGAKKATLSAWMTLQSIPEETIITPNILEFLEQVLEPIPTFNIKDGSSAENDISAEDNFEDSSSGSHAGHAMTSVYTSFPVEVIVYFHMQSSTFRFSCIPVSRVECMLRLPSLDLVFSSKSADCELDEFNNSSAESMFKFHSAAKQEANADSPDADNSRGSLSDDSTVTGGLSVTGCLNDFSLYVFHPYGAGRKKRPEEMVFSPLSSEERKDSLSVNVAFVKFHISRSRKLSYDHLSEKLKLDLLKNGGNATVRFSTIVNIGSASFKYDMRRLTEILVFPRAWYRKTLVRRLFLGELKTTQFHPEDHMETVLAMSSKKASISTTLKASDPSRKISNAVGQQHEKKPITWIGLTTAHSWETLVIFALNFKELNVHMNMGNVMGNVDWISKNFKSEGRLSIGSTGHKNMFITLGLSGSKLEAKGGIVGGAIDVGSIDTYVHLREDSGTEPFHQFGLQLDVMEVRFDYMSTSVLMARVSHLLLRVNDDWHVTDVNDSMTMKPAQIFVQGELSWDQLQMLISKSTTADLLKIITKLEEFFSQQFKSSKKLFSSLEPWNNQDVKKQEFNANNQVGGDSVSHHRHWQKALGKISGMKIYTLPFKLPDIGSVLGGLLELRGSHISLACFHGINFKSKSWALFSLKDPSISFVSDAQEILEDSPDDPSKKLRNTTVIQTLSFSLGQSDQPTRTHHHSYMATVKKISRNISYLPPIKTLADWFSYAFKSSELDEVYRFPTLSASTEKEKEIAKSQQRTEEIFALPCLRMDLKTKHVQGEKVPTVDDPKPVVDCTFVTDFDNHIYVTTDAEAFFFLHDLISSYLKEKERVLNVQQQLSGNPPLKEKMEFSNKSSKNSENEKLESDVGENGSKSDKLLLQKPVDPLQNDWRQFECNTWHLEPTVRLISWAGSQIEPYGIDYILQRLGFNHARTTIPKWCQRGCMDPLDKILSVIVLKTIQVVKEERKHGQENPDELRRKRPT